MLLSARDISKSFGMRSLFSGVSLSIESGQRVGLIGPNGAGKSTLLRILAGQEQPDAGEVIARRGLNVAYVPQTERFADDTTIQQVVADNLSDLIHDEHDRETRAVITLGKLGFTDFAQSPGTLSGGWTKRLAIARQLTREPELLLLDEPTNHLDLEGIEWLEDLLRSSGGSFACVVVTHDRVFLERAVQRVVEISGAYPEGTFEVNGGYDAFVRRREQFLSGQRSTQQALAAKVRLDDRYIAQGAKARTTKRKSHLDDAAERRDQLAELQQRNAPTKAAAVEFEATQRQTKRLLVAHRISKTLGGKPLFTKLDVTLGPGTCTAIAGRNGSGKTTLIKTLIGELEPDEGTIKQAQDLKIVTFKQNRAELDLTQTLQEALCPVSDRIFYRGKEIHVAAWAKRFLFRKQQLNVPVGDLSGGEQARILIANLMTRPADILILDEPTNDLDIPSLEVLEESLTDFPGAIVLVTHDRAMLDRLASDVIGLDGRGQARHFATLAQWQKSMAALEADAQQKPTDTTPSNNTSSGDGDTTSGGGGTTSGTGGTTSGGGGGGKPKRRAKLSYKDQREFDGMEDAILAAEAKAAELEVTASDPKVLADRERLTKVCQQLDAAHAEVKRLYERWAELEAMQAQAQTP